METEEFTSFFDDKACFGRKDLETAADIVLGEFKILSENSDGKSIIEEYRKNLIDKCQECSATQIETIDEFAKMLSDKWRTH